MKCAQLIAFLAVALVGLGGCSDSGHSQLIVPAAPASQPATAPASTASTRTSATISMRNVRFAPESLEIKQGETVKWKNQDLIPHTATGSSFDSGSLAPGESWQHTFAEAGTFPYVCSFHPHMKGVVIVK